MPIPDMEEYIDLKMTSNGKLTEVKNQLAVATVSEREDFHRFKIEVKGISYDTYKRLNKNVLVTTDQELHKLNAERREQGLEPVERCFVYGYSFRDYSGITSATFHALEREDVKAWLKRHSDLVACKDTF